MSDRSPTHEASRSAPSSIARKAAKTSEPSSATPSGLNADFSRVPASTSAIQRVAMEEGGGGGGIMLTEGALSMLPPDVLASLGNALGGEAGEAVKSQTKRSEFSGPGPDNPKTSRQVFSNDVENPRHVVDRSESDPDGFR